MVHPLVNHLRKLASQFISLITGIIIAFHPGNNDISWKTNDAGKGTIDVHWGKEGGAAADKVSYPHI